MGPNFLMDMIWGRLITLSLNEKRHKDTFCYRVNYRPAKVAWGRECSIVLKILLAFLAVQVSESLLIPSPENYNCNDYNGYNAYDDYSDYNNNNDYRDSDLNLDLN